MNEKILFFDQYGSKYGGAQYILIDIINYLLERDSKIEVALPSNQELTK